MRDGSGVNKKVVRLESWYCYCCFEIDKRKMASEQSKKTTTVEVVEIPAGRVAGRDSER